MQQPPPRKGSYLKSCKVLHSDQFSKLQAKNQQECDLLEDIRNFTKQRSAIEKSYGEALCKIASIYQNRKIACVPDIRLEDKSEAWNVYNVWRTVLDETEKLGKARLAAVEVFHQRIAEDAKIVRQNKIYLGKKLSDNLQVIQKELQTQIQDLDRTKRSYYDEENIAYDAREKANAAEEKLKRKKGSIFQSIQSMQKNSAKFTAKKEVCDEKSAGARNDYILSLTSANAHQKRYYEVDFERILRTMECEVYDKVSEYLHLMSRTELLTCSATQNSFNTVKQQAQTITRGYNLRCYLTFYPMLGKNIEYDYERCKGDRIDRIYVHDENAKEQLYSESKRCVSKIQKEIKIIRDATKNIQKITSKGDSEPQFPGDNPPKVEELLQTIRRAETVKSKCEARLEVLKEGGIEVEDYTKSLDNDSFGTDLETPLSHSESMGSVKEEAEPPAAEVQPETAYENRNVVTTFPEREMSVTSEAEREQEIPNYQTQQSLEPWDPTSVDWGDEPISPLPPVANGPQADDSFNTRCIVLYNYEAQNPDELTIAENEELLIMAEGDGDGWVQAKNANNEIGYVPQNYVEAEDGAQPEVSTATSIYSTNATAADELVTESVHSVTEDQDYSLNYDMEIEEYEGEAPPPSGPPSELPPPPPLIMEDNSSQPVVPALDLPPAQTTQAGLAYYCRAMYDYEATCHEELTFEEGQVIRILKKAVNDVDDGWWEGEVDGVVGLFPSLVVEECRMDGEPLTPDATSISSPCTTPPPHTPPEVPGFLLPPEGIIITQPTPEVETVEEAIALQAKQKKERETVGEQHEKYEQQFPSDDEEEQVDSKQPPRSTEQEVSSSSSGSSQSKNGTSPPKNGGVTVSITSADSPPSEVETSDSRKNDKGEDEGELGITNIVITAATPMKESAEDEMPTGEDSRTEADQAVAEDDDGKAESDDIEGEAIFLEDDRPPPPPPAPEGGGGSNMLKSHMEEDIIVTSAPTTRTFTSSSPAVTTAAKSKSKEPDTLESSSATPKSPSPSDGPPDLDPEKLKSLDKIKESIA